MIPKALTAMCETARGVNVFNETRFTSFTRALTCLLLRYTANVIVCTASRLTFRKSLGTDDTKPSYATTV